MSNCKQTSLPLAFSVQASGLFDEDNGLWSTFNLWVGNDISQSFRAVVSTSSFDIWLPPPDGCDKAKDPDSPTPPTNCAWTRGVNLYEGKQSPGYDGSKSSSAKGPLGLQQADLGQQINATQLFGPMYGSRAVGLAWTDDWFMRSSTGPSRSLDSANRTIILAIRDWTYYLPSLGLGSGTRAIQETRTPETDLNSTISDLASTSIIPSRSWGYTAGAYYREQLGSLTLGGYDNGQITGPPLQSLFSNGTLTSTELLVSVQKINLQWPNDTPDVFEGSLFTAILDSTLPYLFLPEPACTWLAGRLNLTLDPLGSGLYLIDQDTLSANRQKDTAFTITIGSVHTAENNPRSGASGGIAITFPHDAFEANASWTWGWDVPQAIFPIRQSNSEVAVLGRPFFQEAYVSVDYDNNVFNVSKASRNPGEANITSLYSPSMLQLIESQRSCKGLNGSAEAGIAVGGIVALLVLALLIWFFGFKPRRRRIAKKMEEWKAGDAGKQEEDEGIQSNARRPRRDRTYTHTSEASSTTVVSGLSELPYRPSHHRNISELSSDSETRVRGRLRSMHGIPEGKSDAVELENLAAAMNMEPRSPAELEGEGHLPRLLPGS